MVHNKKGRPGSNLLSALCIHLQHSQWEAEHLLSCILLIYAVYYETIQIPSGLNPLTGNYLSQMLFNSTVSPPVVNWI